MVIPVPAAVPAYPAARVLARVRIKYQVSPKSTTSPGRHRASSVVAAAAAAAAVVVVVVIWRYIFIDSLSTKRCRGQNRGANGVNV